MIHEGYEAARQRVVELLDEKIEAAKEIESLRQQLADKHRLFMCASANYDRLAEQLAECEREREILKRKAELPMRYKRMEHNASLQRELATVTKERDELVEAVLAVCCDPEGRVVIRGSDGDRAVLQATLAKLGADKTGEV